MTCLDLGAAGAVLTRGWDREVVDAGGSAKQRKRTINTSVIYPDASHGAAGLRGSPASTPPSVADRAVTLPSPPSGLTAPPFSVVTFNLRNGLLPPDDGCHSWPRRRPERSPPCVGSTPTSSVCRSATGSSFATCNGVRRAIAAWVPAVEAAAEVSDARCWPAPSASS